MGLMIRTWADKEAEKLFNRKPSRRIPQGIQKIAFRKLRMLHRSTIMDDLKVPPGNCLEAFDGDRKGQHSIRINDQWKICFVWRNGDGYKVEMTDYL
ncbi:MAG TPA: type II toxin-antitoxin system RelE/ParE family toxin [Desulfomonilaceae bacterium]|nr:type II toxin-antitoxin system RelE/ParE family toxin [Desulfomonilaceae bacterium]